MKPRSNCSRDIETDRGSVRFAERLVAGTARGHAGRPRRAVPRRPRSARRGASLTSRRRIAGIEKPRFQGFFRSRPVSRILREFHVTWLDHCEFRLGRLVVDAAECCPRDAPVMHGRCWRCRRRRRHSRSRAVAELVRPCPRALRSRPSSRPRHALAHRSARSRAALPPSQKFDRYAVSGVDRDADGHCTTSVRCHGAATPRRDVGGAHG
jgi:hypothetical protein